ncbi:MAG: SPASM domain-containing protein [Candidatus Omnitrophica bacterium]|nr:SPASM domain-containing protein [Candidatus Omnitrophota bacterium]
MNDVLTTRAGEAKNRTTIQPLAISCLLPFTQMVIRPDGKVSLCCADALGKVTLGDVTKDRIIDIWRSDTYKEIRRLILKSRRNMALCSGCDYISLLTKDIWYEREYPKVFKHLN